MNIQDDAVSDNAEQKRKFKPISPDAFFKAVQVGTADAVQCMVTPGKGGGLTEHLWARVGTEYAGWITEKSAGRKPAYFSLAGYDPSPAPPAPQLTRWGGREKQNVLWLKAFVIDVDGGPEKLKKHGQDKVYPTAEAVAAAVKEWIQATGQRPSYIVQSGSGGNGSAAPPALVGNHVNHAEAKISIEPTIPDHRGPVDAVARRG